jgi:hypothetical protein
MMVILVDYNPSIDVLEKHFIVKILLPTLFTSSVVKPINYDDIKYDLIPFIVC